MSSRQAKGVAGGHAAPPLAAPERACRPRIERRAVGVARPVLPPSSRVGDVGAHLAAAHEGRIDQILARSASPASAGTSSKCSDWRRTGSSQPMPSHARSRRSPASNSGVQRAVSMSSMRSSSRPPSRARHLGVQQRRIGMAEMQRAVGARGEAEDRAVIGRRVSGCAGHRPIATLQQATRHKVPDAAHIDARRHRRGARRACRHRSAARKRSARIAGEVPLGCPSRALPAWSRSSSRSRCRAPAPTRSSAGCSLLASPLTPRGAACRRRGALREAGLSRPKQRTLLALSRGRGRRPRPAPALRHRGRARPWPS